MYEPNADPSRQLEEDLRASISSALATRRPILTHLNADTTWLLSLALPPEEAARKRHHRFNILIDPWLKGPQSDVASWFSTQWHAVESSVQTIEELNQYLQEVEQLADEAELALSEKPKKGPRRSKAAPLPKDSPTIAARNGATNVPDNFTSTTSYISAVIISHEFTDHCHRATLLELPSSTPIYATSAAVPLIKSWSHFDAVYEIPVFSVTDPWPDLPEHLNATQPSWLRLTRLTTESNALYYHSAVAVLFTSPPSGSICAQNTQKEEVIDVEAVIYTPHGISSTSLLPLIQPASLPSSESSTASIQISPLALLHGLHAVRLQGLQQLNLGLPNALAAQKLLKVPYWVGTHDEEKKGAGVVSWLLRRERWSLKDALGRKVEPLGDEEEIVEGKGKGMVGEEVRYVELRSGEGLLLE